MTFANAIIGFNLPDVQLPAFYSWGLAIIWAAIFLAGAISSPCQAKERLGVSSMMLAEHTIACMRGYAMKSLARLFPRSQPHCSVGDRISCTASDVSLGLGQV